jgi:para-aminobenzoate synthetase component 1
MTHYSQDFESSGDPLFEIEKILNHFAVTPEPGSLPCENGCAAGFISYDFCRALEKVPDHNPHDPAVPEIVLGFYHYSVVVDHTDEAAYFCTATGAEKSEPATIKHEITKIIQSEALVEPGPVSFFCGCPNSDFTREQYCDMIRSAKEYIRNGDIYQVNLSQRFKAGFTGDPYLTYQALRRECPTPFSAYLSLGGIQIASASPERFFEVDGRIVRTRPIKGTRPRGRTREEDEALLSELLHSAKDQSELVMIVDLLRNDLGKVCEIGSVEVERLFEAEAYENVFHLVSTIGGILSKNTGTTNLLRAVFPGGSITGAPKIRAMEIIDELEPIARGIYTGAIGYLGFDGRSDLNIAIRTLVCADQQIYYHVGGGVVWDSDPDAEYFETLDKGKSIHTVLAAFQNEKG